MSNYKVVGMPGKSSRFIIVSSDNSVIDDAQGYGYKTRRNAEKVIWYKFKGGKENTDSKKSQLNKLYKENPGLKDYISDLYEDRFKEIARGEISDKDVASFISEKFSIDFKVGYLKYV